MKNIIIANWKMNPERAGEALGLARTLMRQVKKNQKVTVVCAAPFPFLALLPKSKNIARGAQNTFWERSGSFTGEVSPTMLKSLGVEYVIVGHSERRQHLFETDEMINKKLKASLAAGLRPILCVGESKRDPDGQFFTFLKKQVVSAFAKVPQSQASKVIVTYEPVWAISGSKSAKAARPEDANEAALFIRKTLASIYGVRTAMQICIIYGGSSNAKNTTSFVSQKEISGLLVGRESRKPKEFLAMIECIKSIS